VEVADGLNEAGISDPEGNRDEMIPGSGRRDALAGAVIPEKVVSPANDGVLYISQCPLKEMIDLLPSLLTSHT